MARRSLEKQLEEVRGFKSDPTAQAALACFELTLKNGHAMAVRMVAEFASDFRLRSLISSLEATFERFIKAADKDPGCVGKQACISALIELDYLDASLYRIGIRHVQNEPVWGGTVDTDAGLRAQCAVGLSLCPAPNILFDLVGLLADPEPVARAGAADALANLGRDEGASALRLKLLIGDENAAVISACFTALLAISADQLEFVSQFLSSPNEIAEIAALCLGESRQEEAYQPIVSWLDLLPAGDSQKIGFLALAALRSEQAHQYLLDTVKSEPTKQALSALEALAPYYAISRITAEQLRTIAVQRGGSIEKEFTRIHQQYQYSIPNNILS
jgi:HEAT repeat protein